MFKFSITFIYNSSFLLLFPGCILYLIIVSLGFIPPLLGSYFSTMVAALFIPLLFIDLVFIPRRYNKSTYYELYYYLFILYYLCVIALNFVFLSLAPQVLTNHIANLFYLVTIFLVFKNINVYSKSFYRSNTILLFLLLGLATIQVKDGVLTLIIEGAGFADDHAPYQLIAVIYLICSVFYLAGENKLYKRYLFILFSITFLFVNGARSEFAAFILMVPILEFMKANNRNFVAFLILANAAILFVILWYVKIEFSETNNRIVDLLVNTTNSSSNIERSNRLSEGLDIIMEHPLTGGLALYPPNKYIHNILSAWLDLGLVGFIYYCSLLTAPLFYVIKPSIVNNKISIHLTMIICLAFLSIFLLAMAKTFYYFIVPAYLGLFVNYFKTIRCQSLYSPTKYVY